MINDGKYARVWEKYRPVLLNLMVRAKTEPRSYQLSDHEFIDINPKKVSGYAFSWRFHQGKAMTDIKKSLLAPDLLAVLKRSAKAMELSETAIYDFVMDKTFNITVSCEEVETTKEEQENPEASEEATPTDEGQEQEEQEEGETEEAEEEIKNKSKEVENSEK